MVGHVYEDWPSLARWATILPGASVLDGKLVGQESSEGVVRLNQTVSESCTIDFVVKVQNFFQLNILRPPASNSPDLSTNSYMALLFAKPLAGSEIGDFVLFRRSEWGVPLTTLDVVEEAPYNTEYRIRLALTPGMIRLAIQQYAPSGPWPTLFDASYANAIPFGDLIIALSPGRAYGTIHPSISPVWIRYGITPAEAISLLDTDSPPPIPSIDVPEITLPALVEGRFSTWTSPSFGGGGDLVFTAVSPLPAGVSIGSTGDAFTIAGKPAIGSAGRYSTRISVTNGSQTLEFDLLLSLDVLAAFAQGSLAVSTAAETAGDFYYRRAGGPLRLEAYDE